MKISAIIGSILLSTAAIGAGKPDMIAKVTSGKLKEAKASWWGFDPSDSTAVLQKAINSRVPKLIVDNPGKAWITRPLFAVSNQEIVFEKGVVVEAKKGGFKGGNDSLLTLREQHDVTLRGHSAILRMHRADYADPKLYKKAEWRMVLNILSSKNINVFGLTLALSGGDGIYLGVSKTGMPPENIIIKDVICDRNYRQGISVISARNLLIENTIIRNTGGTPPAAGIDFEPNHSSEELVNCVMRDCISEHNSGCGYAFYLPNLHADSAPLSIRLENCISRNGNRTDLAFYTGNSEKDAVLGTFDLVKCRFERSHGVAISIRNKPAEGVAMSFRDCVIDTPAMDSKVFPPVSIAAGTGSRRSTGGIDFGNLLVIDPVERPFLDFYDWLGGNGILSVKGTVTLRHGNKENVIRITSEWMQKKFPVRITKKIPPLSVARRKLAVALPDAAGPDTIKTTAFFLRRSGRLLFQARKGDTVKFTLAYIQVGHYAGKTLKPKVTTPSGKHVALGELSFQSSKELVFSALETGLYRLPLNPAANKIGVIACSQPVAISGADGPIHFIGAGGDLYFLVPAKTGRFGLVVYGEGHAEAVKATIFDPGGRKVWEKDNITLPVQYAPEITPPARDQVWHLRLSRPSRFTCEDNSVVLLGIPPFLATTPRGLLMLQR